MEELLAQLDLDEARDWEAPTRFGEGDWLSLRIEGPLFMVHNETASPNSHRPSGPLRAWRLGPGLQGWACAIAGPSPNRKQPGP